MKRVLITGSLGYLGSVLTNYLTERGIDCVGYDTGFFKDSILYPPLETKTIFRDVREIKEADLENIVKVFCAEIERPKDKQLRAMERAALFRKLIKNKGKSL